MANLQQKLNQINTANEKINEYAEKIGTLQKVQKKLFRKKELLARTDINEPIMFLKRRNGEIELYHNVKEEEFNVPGLPDGKERKIILGRQYQENIPLADRTFRAYWCHEDYAFPHQWSKPNVYTGKYPQKIKDWITDKEKAKDGIPIILEHANVNSEALRDRERKVLIAWEKFTTSQKALNIKAWAKFILSLLGGIALVYIAYSMFSSPDPTPVIQVVNQTSSGVIIG